MPSGFEINLQRGLKAAQPDAEDGEVEQHRRDVGRIADASELLVRAFVERPRLREAVLAEENIADVAVQTRQSKPVAVALENLPRFLCQRVRLVVAPERDQALKRPPAQRAAHVEVPTEGAKQLERQIVSFQRLA